MLDWGNSVLLKKFPSKRTISSVFGTKFHEISDVSSPRCSAASAPGGFGGQKKENKSGIVSQGSNFLKWGAPVFQVSPVRPGLHAGAGLESVVPSWGTCDILVTGT